MENIQIDEERKMAANCKIYTPTKAVKILLDSVGYLYNLKGKRLLENSCGDGSILSEVVVRYINDRISKGDTLGEIKVGLEVDITGIDTDEKACEKCLARLSQIAESYGIINVNFNIICEDALVINREGYSFVVGNPPYITYHDLTEEERSFLKSKYSVCRKGRFDYYYAFVEQSLKSLCYGGKLAYLIPNSVLKNVWGEELRNYMLPYIRKIIDLKNTRIFDDVTLSPVILAMEKRRRNAKVKYIDTLEQIEISCNRDELQKKWFFGDSGDEHNMLRFGDYFHVANSIATLYNDAFIIKDHKVIDEEYIDVNGHLLESKLLLPAISPRSFQQDKNYLIIFPYRRDQDNNISHFNEKEFDMKFPGISKYLKSFSEKLKERKVDRSCRWFEYGRSQAINSIYCDKLIMPMVVTKQNRVYEATKEDVPYAGYYIRQLGEYSLRCAKKILEDESFLKFIKMKGTPTSLHSYRISVKDINDYYFDESILHEVHNEEDEF